MELYSVLVTGANRGIGLEFVRQLVRLPKPPRFIFATYRSESSLQALKDIQISSENSEVILVKADVTNASDLKIARDLIAEKVGENGLTLLISNAAANKVLKFPNLTEENLQLHFTVNAVGPILLFQEMLPLLQKAAARKSFTKLEASRAAVLTISAMLGSITKTGTDPLPDVGMHSYKISKAALNMSMRIIAANVKEHGILVAMMCPGWVKTDMGSQQAHLTPEESVGAMLDTLSKLDESHHGAFMDRFGSLYPF